MKNKKQPRRWSVEKRLEFIDFCLYWVGQINRSDIMERFGVSVPQASKDLSLYQEAAPKNLDYDHRIKKYFSAKTFKPSFLKPDAEAYLWQMRDDVSAMFGIDGAWLSELPPHDIVSMPRRNVDPQILKEVLATVKERKKLEVYYQSMSSDEPAWREISPHAFGYDGLSRWHIRAFCHNQNKHKDFLLSRILKVGKSTETDISPDTDEVWNEVFTVILKPHPKLSESQSKAVALDYNMKDSRLHVEVRLALLYYFLRRLNLEDYEAEKRNPREQHVVLANKAETKKACERAEQKSHASSAN